MLLLAFFLPLFQQLDNGFLHQEKKKKKQEDKLKKQQEQQNNNNITTPDDISNQIKKILNQ